MRADAENKLALPHGQAVAHGETAGVPKVRKQLWVSTFRLFLQHMKHLWPPNPKASSGQTVGKGQEDQDHTQHLAFAPE